MSYRSISSPRSNPQSPRHFNNTSQVSLTANEVSKLTNTQFRDGESVKGIIFAYEKVVVKSHTCRTRRK